MGFRRFAPLWIVFATSSTWATETDQFSTPPAPLQDIGPRLSRKVVAIIEADRTGRDPDVVLAEWVGHNIFESRMGRWVNRIKAARYRPHVFHSIYRLAFSPAPASFYVDAPTVNVHGYYMGTDKIDHFFQQGHEYFEIQRKDGVGAAINYGVGLEHGYFGTVTTGVYSNADLAANYAGMKFYQSLPLMFERKSEGWRLREGIDSERLLEPFVSNHLDESLNPSRYRFSRRAIRAVVRQRCDAWTQFYSDRKELVAPSGESFASTWFGEDYGHWLPPAEEISIATECGGAIARDMLQSTKDRPSIRPRHQ